MSQATQARPLCSKCGHLLRIHAYYFSKKEKRFKTVYECVLCHTNTQNPFGKKSVVDTKEFTDDYLDTFSSIKKTAQFYGLKNSTAYLMIRNEVEKAPDGITLSLKLRNSIRWGYVLGVDLGFFGKKKDGINCGYMHFSDVLSKDRLYYDVQKWNDGFATKNENMLFERLQRIITELSYKPKIFVHDLDDNVINACTRTDPLILQIGCLFHLRLSLDKKLPTKRLKARVNKKRQSAYKINPDQLPLFDDDRFEAPLTDDEARVLRYENAKNIMMRCASANEESRTKLLSELNCCKVGSGRKVTEVIEEFKRKLKFFPVKEKLLEYGLTTDELRRVSYNNACENAVGMVRLDLWKKHRGFKSLTAFRAYVNYYWQIKRTERYTITDLDYYF